MSRELNTIKDNRTIREQADVDLSSTFPIESLEKQFFEEKMMKISS
jgi:hypothetical protein